ncbi:MAG: DUF2214 family protein [Rhizobacter sp.]|jgi:putative membrane protein
MLAASFVSFLHFAAAFGVFGTLLGEWLLLSRAPDLANARRLQQLDRWYGMCAVVLLVAGLLRAWRYEKGLDFYLATPFFHAKLTFFVLLGLLSIYPTVVFIRWGRDTRRGQVPVLPPGQQRTLARLVQLELLAFAAVVACATLMARGAGA